MSLNAIAKMTQDNGLIERVASAAALAGVPDDARLWATNRMWKLSALDGWSKAYALGLEKENYQGDSASYASVVGIWEDFITDEMIIAGVNDLVRVELEAVEAERAARLVTYAHAQQQVLPGATDTTDAAKDQLD